MYVFCVYNFFFPFWLKHYIHTFGEEFVSMYPLKFSMHFEFKVKLLAFIYVHFLFLSSKKKNYLSKKNLSPFSFLSNQDIIESTRCPQVHMKYIKENT